MKKLFLLFIIVIALASCKKCADCTKSTMKITHYPSSSVIDTMQWSNSFNACGKDLKEITANETTIDYQEHATIYYYVSTECK
jgi:hypothetical protein